jgi:hypothetical protein
VTKGVMLTGSMVLRIAGMCVDRFGIDKNLVEAREYYQLSAILPRSLLLWGNWVEMNVNQAANSFRLPTSSSEMSKMCLLRWQTPYMFLLCRETFAEFGLRLLRVGGD